jgi:hypothetical protein
MADGLQWRNAWTCTYSIVQGILDGEFVDFCSAMQEHELNAMERLRLIKLEVRVRAETSTQDVISDDHTLGEW